MARSKRANRFADVAALSKRVERVVNDMRRERRDDFDRNAQALFDRAKDLADRAAKLKLIDERFPIEVRAIVLDRRSGGKNRAVIFMKDSARIYAEGDALEDAEGRPFTVARISEGSIKFQFE